MKVMKALKIIGGILAGLIIVPIALAFAIGIGVIVVTIVIIVKIIRLITFADLRKKRRKQKLES